MTGAIEFMMALHNYCNEHANCVRCDEIIRKKLCAGDRCPMELTDYDILQIVRVVMNYERNKDNGTL